MKIAVAALIRNEIDIIGSFLQHLDALFDYALLMNHGSVDGTDRLMAEACARRPGWTMWHIEAAGYHQAVFSVYALVHLFQQTDADVVMFLDADEFINVPDRASLEAAFSRLSDPDSIGYLFWRNIVPARLDTRVINPGDAIWLAPGRLPLGKVVMQRSFFVRHGHEVELTIGNHSVIYDGERGVPMQDLGEILHLPIRSHVQLKTKIVAGVFALMQRSPPDPVQGWHWYDILWRIADGTLRDDDVIGIAAHYSQQGEQTKIPMSWGQLQASGFVPAALNVAFGRSLSSVTEPLEIDPFRLMATILRRFTIEDVRNSMPRLDGNVLRFVPRVNTGM